MKQVLLKVIGLDTEVVLVWIEYAQKCKPHSRFFPLFQILQITPPLLCFTQEFKFVHVTSISEIHVYG